MTSAHPKYATLADIKAIEQVPLWERIKHRSTYDVLKDVAARFPSRPAIHYLPNGQATDTPVEITFRQLFGRITQTANLLNDLGVRADEPISFMLPNIPQTYFVFWGAEAAGVANPINPMLDPVQIVEIMRAVKSRRLVALGPFPGTDIWQKALEVRRLMPEVQTLIQVGGLGDEKEGVLSFEVLLDRYPADHLISGRQIGLDEVCSYFHTGGTTAAPKIAPHLHRGEVAMAWAHPTMLDLGLHDVMMSGLPLFHVYGAISMGLGTWAAGASVVLVGPAGYRNPAVLRDFWKIVEHYRVTHFCAVPTIYGALLNVPVGEANISSLRASVCGAAPMSVELLRAFESATGLSILEGYGLTEATAVVCINPRDGQRRIGSVGFRLPYQSVSACVLDSTGRYVRDCEPQEVGAIIVSGDNVFPGYLEDRLNEGLWAKPGWLNTGDLGWVDEDGYIWLSGRVKDLIIRGGHNIDPAAIEEVLHQHPAVAGAAAVGRPDARAGELPMAFVELKPGTSVSEKELRDFARERVRERTAAPVDVVVLPRLPLTAVGKIFKPELRHLAICRTFVEELHKEGIEAEVTVAADREYGTVSTIALKSSAHEPQARKILLAFPVKYRFA